MEVHHHTNSSNKKFTHYLWEFLMLFLAVFCGFLAENQRELMVEHQRERQYIKSLNEDVEGDIKQINRLQVELNDFIGRLDSIADDLDQSFDRGPSLTTYKQIAGELGFSDFIYTDRTMQQLKNAGGMRLIRNQRVADSIVVYDAMVRRGLVLQDLLNTLYIPRLLDKVNYTLNTTEIYKIAGLDCNKIDTNNFKKTVLLIHDKTEMIRFVNELRHYRRGIKLQLGFITNDKALALRLCALMKKEYHLE